MTETDVILENFYHGLDKSYKFRLRQHLAQVYSILGATTIATTIGVLSQINQWIDMGPFAILGVIVMIIILYFYKDNGENYNKRLGILLFFGFSSGQILGPVMDYIDYIDPSIILTALASTAIIFVSLSCSALIAERGKYLFLGGLSLSILNTLAIISLLNMFFESFFIQMVELYISLFVLAAIILFDTQNIMEKRRSGDKDAVKHALVLFFDIFRMFRRILLTLAHKVESRGTENRESR